MQYSNILFHLSVDKKSFIYELHENNVFNLDKFRHLIKDIKNLKKLSFMVKDLDKEFIYIILDRTHLIHFIYSDVRMGYTKINIDNQDFFEYFEELLYELKSLFNDTIVLDYNGHSY